MQDMGNQMRAILERRFERVVPDAAVPLTEEIFDQMLENTSAGRTFQGLYYDSRYEPKYAAKRARQGYQTSYTDLRFSTNPRITQRKAAHNAPAYAEMNFMDNTDKRGVTAGNIFYYHQVGVRYKNGKMKIRQTMPVVWDNVPKDMFERFVARIVRVMNGK